MAGKRYTGKEVGRIIELKDSGKTFDEVAQVLKTEFSTTRHVRSLKIIYDRNKDTQAAVVHDQPKAKKTTKAVKEEAVA
jgi:hypothetical protein